MRVLLALTEVFHSYGGIPMFNRALLYALGDFCQRFGGQVTALSLNDCWEDIDSRYVVTPSVEFQAFCRNKSAFALAFGRHVLGVRPTLTVIGHVNLLPLAFPLPQLSCPYLLLAHGIEAWQRLPWVARRALARAQAVLAVSDYTRRRLSRENGVHAEHWRVFPNTLDPFYTPLPPAPDNRLTLLSVSRLDPSERPKGIEQVLELLPALRQRFPELLYVVVGEGTDRPRLEQRARELGVAEVVQFTGQLSPVDLLARYAACSAFVLPSTKEGFGIVFLEAMAHGKPVVAVRSGGVPEVVADGETGLLVEPGNPQALLAALTRVLADPELRQRWGAAGRRRFEENFTFAHFSRRLLWLLEEWASGDYSLQAERDYYHRNLPDKARDYRWLHTYLDCLPDVRPWFTGRKILDIGAGECLYSALLADRYAARVVALELLPERMQPAKRSFRLANLFFVAGDCHRLPFPDDSFDTVFGDLVLHHFPMLEWVVAEISRVLRPGGAYVGIEPNFYNPAQRLVHRFGAKSANERAHSPAHLRWAFERVGFKVELHFFWRRFPRWRNRLLSSSVGILAHTQQQ